MREVGQLTFGLPISPLRRTVAGCLLVLGDRFGGVSKAELRLAVVAVQTWITLQMNESDRTKK